MLCRKLLNNYALDRHLNRFRFFFTRLQRRADQHSRGAARATCLRSRQGKGLSAHRGRAQESPRRSSGRGGGPSAERCAASRRTWQDPAPSTTSFYCQLVPLSPPSLNVKKHRNPKPTSKLPSNVRKSPTWDSKKSSLTTIVGARRLAGGEVGVAPL